MYWSKYRVRLVSCLLPLLVVCLWLTGCKEMKVAPVKGTVTLDGAPLPNASVRFQPVAGGRPSVGFTDEDGSYVLDYSMREAGAEVGACEVHITTGGGGDYDAAGNQAQKAGKNQIPKKYADEPPVVEVEPKSNVIDIALTSD